MVEVNLWYAIFALGFIVLVAFLAVALWRLTKVLQELEETLKRVDHIADSVDSVVTGLRPAATTITALLSGISTYLSKVVIGTKAGVGKQQHDKE